ncbi:winged helix-turn-helix domain-containing protein [Actinomycetes bacterium KLBMP 9797]
MGVALGDTRRSAANWCRRYTGAGDGAIAARRRNGALTPAQELHLVETLRDRYPEEFDLPGSLWTRQSVATLVERTYGVALSVPGIARYLRAWGLGPREPVDRACALCAVAVVRWQAHRYPEILRAAHDERADVYWAGGTRLHGVAPTTEVVAAVSTRGWVRFMVTGEPTLPREFLSRLATQSGRPAHVIVDGSWTTMDWPRRLPDDVVLHPLPTCDRTR